MSIIIPQSQYCCSGTSANIQAGSISMAHVPICYKRCNLTPPWEVGYLVSVWTNEEITDLFKKNLQVCCSRNIKNRIPAMFWVTLVKVDQNTAWHLAQTLIPSSAKSAEVCILSVYGCGWIHLSEELACNYLHVWCTSICLYVLQTAIWRRKSWRSRWFCTRVPSCKTSWNMAW